MNETNIHSHKKLNSIFIGLFTFAFTVFFGMGLAFATGMTTPAKVFAQLAPPCCDIPPPPPVIPPPPPVPVPVVPTPVTIYGCMDPAATNYNPNATSQSGVTCTYPPPPAPTCTLSANPTSIQTGGSSSLSWTTTNATSFSIDNGIGSVTPVASGTTSVSPTATTTFTGTATGSGGSVTCKVTVDVAKKPCPPPPVTIYGCMDPAATNYNPNATSQSGVTCTYPPPPAPTCTLSANPTSIQTGGSSSLSWTTTNATSFSIDNGIGSVTPVASGTTSVSPTATTTFTGTATGSGGSVTCKVTVDVAKKPCPPPPVTIYGCMDPAATNYNPNATSQSGVTCTYPPPPAPTCTLSANPTSIQTGGSSSLSWTTTNATSFSIDNGIGSVTPVDDGSATSTAIATSTVFTGTATGAGGSVQCSATVSTNGAVSISPSCSLSMSPTSISSGDSATLTWGGAYIQSVFIDNGIGTTTDVSGSQSVSPDVGSYTYTGTFYATNGQTLTCAAALAVIGGGGGCSGNCGGGGGGGGGGGSIISTVIPTMTLSGGVQPLAFLSLSQIPYTGLDLGPVGTVVYWLALVCFALALAYLVLFGIVPFIIRRARNFSSRVSAVLNAPAQPIIATAPIREAPREYSSYDGFKSFARNGALSIEDIVKSLSGESAEKKVEPAHEKVEPIYKNVEPIVDVEPVIPNATANFSEVPAHIRGFAVALIEGDRAGVFAGLRQQVRGGGAPEQFINSVACVLDDTYRARIDGTACDSDIARRAARISTPLLEKIVASLTTAIDSSYSDDITGAKLALTRALAILGA